jgi:hypothetical protein
MEKIGDFTDHILLKAGLIRIIEHGYKIYDVWVSTGHTREMFQKGKIRRRMHRIGVLDCNKGRI